MSGVDDSVVGSRLATMHDLLGFLDGLGQTTGEELRRDLERRLAVERAICQLVDQAVDINSHIATRILGRSPQTQRESFQLTARAGFLSGDLAAAISPSVGLRNLLVHDYAQIDLDRVADAIPVAARDYAAYVRAISRALVEGPVRGSAGA